MEGEDGRKGRVERVSIRQGGLQGREEEKAFWLGVSLLKEGLAPVCHLREAGSS